MNRVVLEQTCSDGTLERIELLYTDDTGMGVTVANALARFCFGDEEILEEILEEIVGALINLRYISEESLKRILLK